ncbi:MAG: VWA domain-containing protein, partial [Candidatus Hydrogenedentes bacterium]|nr:VWA domain-containing protein [Candidatus Hydrogenedentota bacterium]
EPAPQVARVPLEQAVQKARQESPYVFIDDLVDIRLETYAAAGDSVGYFRLRVIPKEDQSIEVLPKDITFVIDASSSIPQFKLNKTVNGVVRALDYLRAQDMFNIVIFRETPELFQGQPVAATPENKAAAKSFLARVPSHGQTDVYNGILPVLHALPRGGVPAIVLVMSDGRPTTGIQDARAIINGLTTDNNHVHSIYAFGGGNTVNRYLLDLLAYRNKGEAHVAEQVERIDEELPRFAARLADPLLVNLRANFSGIDVAELAPSLIPDFYKGQVVTIYGSYKISGVKEFVVRLTGRALDQKKELVFRADLAQATVGDREIARNWAFQKSYDIIGEISRVGAQPELVTALRQLSQQFNIRTAYAE